MTWLLSRIVGGLKGLLLVAAIGGPFLAYTSWSDTERIHDIKARGVETVATIEGATERKSRRGGTSYTVALTWKDGTGQMLNADGVAISRQFANRIVANGRLVRSTVRIKYLDDGADVKPILVEDVEEQEGLDATMVQVGAVGGALGIVGSGLMFWVGRRRRVATA